MPTPFADHTGEKYGNWTVLYFHGRTADKRQVWICECVCGVKKPVIMATLTGGHSKSCGCVGKKLRAEKQIKHGMAGTPTYKSWHQMHQRCAGKHGHDYYLKQGIKVCQRWHDFDLFYQDMGDRPFGTTLDRIDGSKGYEPGNCRWATSVEQANNRKTNIKQFVMGELLTPAEAARRHGKHISGVRHRLRKGWSLEKAVLTPNRNAQTQ